MQVDRLVERKRKADEHYAANKALLQRGPRPAPRHGKPRRLPGSNCRTGAVGLRRRG